MSGEGGGRSIEGNASVNEGQTRERSVAGVYKVWVIGRGVIR